MPNHLKLSNLPPGPIRAALEAGKAAQSPQTPKKRAGRPEPLPTPETPASVRLAQSVTLPYPPTINTFWRVVNGRPIISAKGRAYKALASSIAAASGMKPIDGPVAVTMTVYRPRKAGDLDNTLKVALDSLKGIGFADDSQIVKIEAMRADDAANPRAEIIIAPAVV